MSLNEETGANGIGHERIHQDGDRLQANRESLGQLEPADDLALHLWPPKL